LVAGARVDAGGSRTEQKSVAIGIIFKPLYRHNVLNRFQPVDGAPAGMIAAYSSREQKFIKDTLMTAEQAKDQQRLQALRQILNHERNEALARVRDYRRDQEQEAVPLPGDEMDVARSTAEVETHASLIDRVENRLKAIDFAFNRLEQGRYGICAQCNEQISVERLHVLPFAAYCVDCQETRNHRARAGKTWIDEPFIHQWDLPEGMEETTENSHDEFVPLPAEDDLSVAVAQPRGKKSASRSRRMRGGK
jgi:DnaK suppressor protein